MSGSALAAAPLLPPRAWTKLGHLGWSAACIHGLAGCLYTAPVWRPEVNAAPRIVDPEGPKGTEHVRELFADGQILQVIATDTDGDDLVFVWDVPGYELQPTTSSDEGGLWSSYVSIPYDPDLDGVLIRVVVIDQSPAHNSQPVLFRVEVP